jgi:ATP-dependent Lon protease
LAITPDNDLVIKIGRGLDIHQWPRSWFELGAHDMGLRRCLETSLDIFRQ